MILDQLLLELEQGLPLIVRSMCFTLFLPASLLVRVAAGVALVSLGWEAVQLQGEAGGNLVPEAVVGALLGCCILLVREMGLFLGSMLDTACGQTLGSIHNPITLNMESSLGKCLAEVVWLYVVVEGGLPLIFRFHVLGLSVWPIGNVSLLHIADLGSQSVYLMLPVIAECFRVLSFFALLFVMIDGCLGLLTAAWRVPLGATEAIVLRTLVTFCVLAVTLQSGAPVNWELALGSLLAH